MPQDHMMKKHCRTRVVTCWRHHPKQTVNGLQLIAPQSVKKAGSTPVGRVFRAVRKGYSASLLAARASASISSHLPALTMSSGATHEPPTQMTLGKAR